MKKEDKVYTLLQTQKMNNKLCFLNRAWEQ